LRLTLSNYLKKHYGLDYDPEEEILITVGVSEALDLALRAILNPKDKVIIVNPSYVSYARLVELGGATPVFINTESTNFKLTPLLLERHIGKNTKAIILNYPTKPTGVSYTKRELEEIKKIILKHKILCISDEIYGELTYDFVHTPFATLSGARDFTIYLNGFSKAYAMTGWRIGYACGPKEVISAMTKIHQYTIMCVPTTSQIAACEALVSAKKELEIMKREYKRRREFLVDSLNKLGLTCPRPEGAFYVFCSIKNTGLNDLEFAQRLLKEEKVALVPGSAFGRDFFNYVRISYASNFENLKEAVLRIERFLKKLRRGGRDA
ncbi:MAG: aminotransferase class I/II-fold pyridoxal phosphate-dependent enzyme, partial [Candidatus Omnitrophica bacterium]|nr:aminotransferase class I/II-fold pyridoxal phosphate-dependent enzyme [Candidatus Omnitrophota bacterium]